MSSSTQRLVPIKETPFSRRTFLKGALGAAVAASGMTSIAGCSGTSASTAEKTIRFGVANSKTTLDIQKTTNFIGVSENVCEGILEMDSNSKIQPLLVKALPTVSDDGLTYTFELKDNITFQNGAKLTTADIKYTFERMFTPTTKAQSTGGYDYITGASEMLAGKATELAGLKITDDTHFSFTLWKGYSTFSAMLTEPYAAIYPHEACAAAGDNWGSGTNLIGTGPFKLTSNDDSTEVVMEKYEGYHGGVPAIDKVEIKYIDDANTRMLNYVNGDIDTCFLDVSLLTQYKNDDKVKDQIVMYQPASTQFVNLNLTSAPLADVRVRKALSLAINRQEICDTIFSGAATPATSFVGPAEQGYDSSLSVFEYNPDSAKALLAEAGATNLSLTAQVRSQDQKVMVAIQGYWKAVGVSLDVQVIDAGVWSDSRANGSLQVTSVTWSTLCFEGMEHIQSYFSSTRSIKKSSFYQSAEFDALVDKCQRSTKEDEIISLTRQADQLLTHTDYACLPIDWPMQPYVVKKGYTGLWCLVDFHFRDVKKSS